MALVKAIGVVAGSGYLLVIVTALCLPETKGKALVAETETARNEHIT
jgi:hypothetical protein